MEAAEDAQQFFQRTTGHLFPAPTSGSSRLLIIQNPTPTLDSQGTHTAIKIFSKFRILNFRVFLKLVQLS